MNNMRNIEGKLFKVEKENYICIKKLEYVEILFENYGFSKGKFRKTESIVLVKSENKDKIGIKKEISEIKYKDIFDDKNLKKYNYTLEGTSILGMYDDEIKNKNIIILKDESLLKNVYEIGYEYKKYVEYRKLFLKVIDDFKKEFETEKIEKNFRPYLNVIRMCENNNDKFNRLMELILHYKHNLNYSLIAKSLNCGVKNAKKWYLEKLDECKVLDLLEKI